jgi:hypothetical protein
MAEQTINSEHAVPPEPELRRREHQPQGVLRKNLKPLIYLGATALVVFAAIFSGSSTKTPSQSLNRRLRGMSRPSRPFRTTLTTMSRISRISLQSSARRKHRLQQLRCRRRRTLRWPTPLWPSRQLQQPTGRTGKHCCVRRASPARNSKAGMRNSRSLLSANKRSSWRQRSGNWLTIRDLRPILSIHAQRTHRLNPVLM